MLVITVIPPFHFHGYKKMKPPSFLLGNCIEKNPFALLDNPFSLLINVRLVCSVHKFQAYSKLISRYINPGKCNESAWTLFEKKVLIE